MLRRSPFALLAALLAALAPAVPTPAAGAEISQVYARIAARTEVMVTVRFVLNVKMEGANSDREFEGEISCLLIDAEGLVLCSNTELGGYVPLMGRLMGGSGINISAAPKDLEVFLEADAAEGIDARLLARDSDRDLAWVAAELPEGHGHPVLDLAESAELAAGDRFYLLRRMDKFFGRSALVSEGTIGAVVEQPRKLYVPSAPTTGGFGLPIFDASGRLVGLTVLQMPLADEQAGSLLNTPLSFLSQAAHLQDMVGGLILPAAEALKATRLARESFADEEEAVE